MNHPVTRHAYDWLAAHYSERDNCPIEREIDRFMGLVSYGGWVRDLGCGSGRYARVLLMSGIRVVGLDLSLSMLPDVRAADATPLVCADQKERHCDLEFISRPAGSGTQAAACRVRSLPAALWRGSSLGPGGVVPHR